MRKSILGLAISQVLCMPEMAAEAPSGSAAAFNPSEVNQGEGAIAAIKEAAQVQEQSQEETGSVSEEAEEASEGDTTQEASTVTDEDKGDEDASEEASEGSEAEYTYKGMAVEITNTPEMVEAFKEKELDIDAVNKELYSEEGLSEEMRTKLDEAFGKMAVGMYLEGLESKNQAMYNSKQAELADNDAKMTELTKTATGDNFDAVMKWANDNLSADQYTAYADIINGDNLFQVELALKDLTIKSGVQSNKLDQPKVTAKAPSATEGLLSADNTTTVDTSSAISSKEFKEAIANGEYAKNMASWDARRRAGMEAGMP